MGDETIHDFGGKNALCHSKEAHGWPPGGDVLQIKAIAIVGVKTGPDHRRCIWYQAPPRHDHDDTMRGIHGQALVFLKRYQGRGITLMCRVTLNRRQFRE